MILRPLLALLVAGWLAEALASQDRDVAAGIAAHEKGEYAEALTRYDAAQERLGERAEIHFNRGLSLLASGDVEAARTAFERGTESDRDNVRSSSFYELGNLSFDAEDWEAAIGSYVECLKIRPDHGSAKWNLELALLRKEEQEKEQEKEDQEDQDGDGEESEDEEKEEGEEGEENEDQEKQEGDENQEQDDGEEEEQEDESGNEGEEDQQDPGEQDQQEQENQQDEPQDSDSSEEQEEPPPAQPIDRANLDKALEGLDAEDNFMLTRPSGRGRRVEKDW